MSIKAWRHLKVLLLIPSVMFLYGYIHDAAYIGLSFGNYGVDCPDCRLIYRSQWHFMVANLVGAALVFVPCWVAMGSSRTKRDALVLVAMLAAVIVLEYTPVGLYLAWLAT